LWAKSMMHPFFSWCRWDSSYTIHIIIRLIVYGHSTLSIICKGYRFRKGMISRVLCAVSNLVLWQYFSGLLLWCNSPGPKKQPMRHVDAGKELELAKAFLFTIYLHISSSLRRQTLVILKCKAIANLEMSFCTMISTQSKPLLSQLTFHVLNSDKYVHNKSPCHHKWLIQRHLWHKHEIWGWHCKLSI
jgi:hypothetical protein